VQQLGGQMFRLLSGGAGTFRFALPTNTARVRVFYLSQGANIGVQTNLGSIGSITDNTQKVEYKDFAVQPGATYAELIQPAAQTIYVCGIYALSATQKAVLVNAGQNGALVSTYTGNSATYDPIPTLKNLAPSLSIINLTINDANSNTAILTYQTGLATLIETALLGGDVALEFGFPSNNTQATDGTNYAVRKAVLELAQAYNLSVISFPAVVRGSWANANAAGYTLDNLHANYSGYGREAQYAMKPLIDLVMA